ncbi:MAG: hypothetical protein K940chlam9_01610 [Chlamydiae bacterium]|nr:hypothetical protein [Chlamydiota bacterium]
MYSKLNPCKLGLAAGVLWGLSLLFMTWISIYTGWGMYWLSQWMDVYVGYDVSIGGTFVGLLYGFVDGFVTFFIFGWLYNLFKP